MSAALVEKLEKASTIAGDANAKKAIENLIAHVQSQDPKFTELRMVNNAYLISLPDDEREDIYARFIAALKASKFVTDIYIANCGLNDKVGVKFAQLLLTNTTIQDLSLE